MITALRINNNMPVLNETELMNVNGGVAWFAIVVVVVVVIIVVGLAVGIYNGYQEAARG
ncbi:MAG: class IIb bacteriocin, lactobin A/cerein 7B family [Ruminiclostridium sp.]